MRHFITAILLAATLMAGAQQNDYCGPVPNANQLRWQQMEMYAFIHYSLNTYTDQEWGFGNEDPKLFNPSDLDCRQGPHPEVRGHAAGQWRAHVVR